jgi:uncharacterized protein (DUF2147 family)
MKRIICATATAFCLMTATALAQDPTGEWLITDGFAHIKVDKCGDQYWGVVSWEQRTGGMDVHNPDVAKRNRPTLGMPILLGMKQTQPNRWEGQIYNSESGKTYTGNISLPSPDVLRVEGCLLIFCGGQNWTRVAKTEQPTTGRANPPAPTRSAQSRSGAPPASQEFCANVTKRMGS